MAFSTIQGSGGAPDSFVGTSGVDVVLIQNNPGPVFAGGRGDADTIQFQEFTQLVSGYTLRGGQGNDTIGAIGTTFSGSLANGNLGDDNLDFGLVASSSIFGGQGDDTIFVGNLNGSILNGNAAIDTITVTASAGSSIFGGQGADVVTVFGAVSATDIRGDIGNDRINILDTTLTNSTVNGSDGQDTIIVSDRFGLFTSTDSTIYGGEGDDDINASDVLRTFATVESSGVTLSGDDGNDTIVGSAFVDNLFGGDGNDRITGGVGADTMTGGAGVNTFVFAAGDFGNIVTGAVDVITDFKVGVTSGDVITGVFAANALTVLDSDAATAGVQGFATYELALTAAGASAAQNVIAAVGTNTSFTAFIFNNSDAATAGGVTGAVQLNGTGQYGSAALATQAIVAGQFA